MTDNGSQSQDSSPDGESQPSLTSRVVKSAGWVFAGKIFSRGLSLVKMVVLARLLDPKDFGLFGIVMLVIATVRAFTKTGFNKALIQKQGDTEEYLDTAWTVQVIRACLIAAALFFAAPLVGWFFEEPRAVLLLRVMCISVTLGGFVNIGMIYFKKELQLHKNVAYKSLSAVISLIVGIILAYQLRSVWALIWAGLAGKVGQVVLSYLFHPYRPSISLDRHKAQELFTFGRWVLASSIVIMIATQGDDAFLGKVLGASALGLYQMAYRISNLPATQITHAISGATFPAYSKIAQDTKRFRSAYLRTLSYTMYATTPIAAGIAAVAPVFVPLVLGQKWTNAIVPIQLLCLFGWLRAFGATLGPVFYASGQPQELTKVTLLQVVLMAFIIWPLTRSWQVTGTCIAVVIPMAVAQSYAAFRACSILHLEIEELLKELALHVGVGTLVFVSAYVVIEAGSLSLLTLLLAIGSGVLMFSLCTLAVLVLGVEFRAIEPLRRTKLVCRFLHNRC